MKFEEKKKVEEKRIQHPQKLENLQKNCDNLQELKLGGLIRVVERKFQRLRWMLYDIFHTVFTKTALITVI